MGSHQSNGKSNWDLNKNVNSDCQENNNTNTTNNLPNEANEDWYPLMLMGLSAFNPTASLMQLDPFSVPLPEISVVPPTPDTSIKNAGNEEGDFKKSNCNCNSDKPQVQFRHH